MVGFVILNTTGFLSRMRAFALGRLSRDRPRRRFSGAFLMARLSTEKFERLKKAFAEQAMTPGQAAPAVGVTYVTAKRTVSEARNRVTAA